MKMLRAFLCLSLVSVSGSLLADGVQLTPSSTSRSLTIDSVQVRKFAVGVSANTFEVIATATASNGCTIPSQPGELVQVISQSEDGVKITVGAQMLNRSCIELYSPVSYQIYLGTFSGRG